MSQSDTEIVDGEIVTSTAVVPHTGEILSLGEMTLSDIARVLDETKQFKYEQLAGFEGALKAEVLRRQDEACEWTSRVGGWKLTGDSPNRSEWDVHSLQIVLESLVNAGELTREAASKAIREKVEYSVSVSGVNALCKRGGLVEESIEACRLPSSKPRGVRVSRELG